MAGEIKRGQEQVREVGAEGQENKTRDVLEVSQEAIDSARTFLAETQAEFDRLFGQLELADLSDEELEAFSQRYEEINALVQDELSKLSKEKAVEAADLDLGDIFGEENVADSADDLFARESALSRLTEEALKRRSQVNSEVGRRRESKKREEEKRKEEENFVPGIEKSGLKNQLVFQALEAADPERVNRFVQEKIQNPPEEMASQIERVVEAAKAEFEKKIQELEKQHKKEEADLERQKRQVREKFEPAANLKTARDILNGNDKNQKDVILSRLRNIPEGQSPEEYARAMVEAGIEKEFKSNPAVQAELARIESDKQAGEEKYKNSVAEVEQIASTQQVETIKKLLGEKFVPELLRLDISKDVLAEKLADEIYKEERGRRGTALDMRAALNLPEKVTGALLKKYTLPEMGQLVYQGAFNKEKAPAIYWSKAFETRLSEMQKETKALRDSSVLNMREGSAEYNQLVAHLKEADLAYRDAEKSGDRKGMEAAAKKYNDAVGEELKKLLRIQQLTSAVAGENRPAALNIGESSRLNVDFSKIDGKLMFNGDSFPDSEGISSYFPKIAEHTYAYGAKSALELEESQNGTDVRYKKEVDLLLKHYKNVWQREGVDGRISAIGKKEENIAREERKLYYAKQQETEEAFQKTESGERDFIEKSKLKVERLLQDLQNLEGHSLEQKIQAIEQEINNFSSKPLKDGGTTAIEFSQKINLSRDAKVEEMIQEGRKVYETVLSGLREKQNQLAREWKTKLDSFKQRVRDVAFNEARVQAEREQQAQQEKRRQEAEQLRAAQERIRQAGETQRQELEAGAKKLDTLGAEFSSFRSQYEKARQDFVEKIEAIKKEREQTQKALGKNKSESSKFGLFTRTVDAVDSQGNSQKVNKEQMQGLIQRQESEIEEMEQRENTLDSQRKEANADYTRKLEETKEAMRQLFSKHPELRSKIPDSLRNFNV